MENASICPFHVYERILGHMAMAVSGDAGDGGIAPTVEESGVWPGT